MGNSERVWQFHPFEMAFVGPPGSGKTTLLERLIAAFRARGFEAASVETAPRLIDGDPGLLEADLLLIEGHRGPALEAIALLDPGAMPLADPARPPLAVITAGPRPGLPWEVPTFHRDDVEGILAFLLGRFEAITRARPLLGLVLTGGRSRRMGTDKAALEYGGMGAAERAFALLKPRCDEVFVSCRADQAEEPGRQGHPQIHDLFLDQGPAGGILSAFEARPEAAWLVLACDLPCLDEATLDRLKAGRNPYRFATAFRGHQDLPEPLCALYEPTCRARLSQFLALGQRCPRRMLIHSPVALLDAPGHPLANVNTPAERLEALHDLRR